MPIGGTSAPIVVPCALACGNPNTRTSTGTRTTAPPIPIRPESTPTKRPVITNIQLSFIASPPRRLAPRSCISYARRVMSTPRGAALVAAAAATMLVGCGPDDYNPGPETCDRSEERNPAVCYTQG